MADLQTIKITVEQKLPNSYGSSHYIYTREYTDILFRPKTILLWFKLKIGNSYTVKLSNYKKFGGFLNETAYVGCDTYDIDEIVM